jgi:hypothetical protein
LLQRKSSRLPNETNVIHNDYVRAFSQFEIAARAFACSTLRCMACGHRAAQLSLMADFTL